jgi:hypothetical protein
LLNFSCYRIKTKMEEELRKRVAQLEAELAEEKSKLAEEKKKKEKERKKREKERKKKEKNYKPCPRLCLHWALVVALLQDLLFLTHIHMRVSPSVQERVHSRPFQLFRFSSRVRLGRRYEASQIPRRLVCHGAQKLTSAAMSVQFSMTC